MQFQLKSCPSLLTIQHLSSEGVGTAKMLGYFGTQTRLGIHYEMAMRLCVQEIVFKLIFQ